MRTYGLEYTILPPVGLFFFRVVSEFSWPAALANNCILTLVCAMMAYWRSKQLAKGLSTRRPNYDNLEPMWPALVFLGLLFAAALQLIFSVTHISYYRDGPFVPDLFDR